MADDNANPAPASAPVPGPTAVPLAPQSFSPEYVHELREENKGWRLKADEQGQKRKAAEDAAKKASEEAEAKVKAADEAAARKAAAAETAANERVIRAELRTAAIKAGMVDLDGLKLADLSTVKLNDAGEVEGAEALMEALKAAKPYLFGPAKPGNTNPNPPPTPKPVTSKKATEMNDEEWLHAQRRIDSGQGVPR